MVGYSTGGYNNGFNAGASYNGGSYGANIGYGSHGITVGYSANGETHMGTPGYTPADPAVQVFQRIEEIRQSYGPYSRMPEGSTPTWDAYAGAGLSIGSATLYSEKTGTWMGKDFKLRETSINGNGTTGGKYKFAQKWSNRLEWGGRGLALWNAVSVSKQALQGEITPFQWGLETASNAISTFPAYGGAWSIGWEAGRYISSTACYQTLKYNFWRSYWESKIGAPSQSNEYMWNYLNENYK